jgi:arylsulfatase A-like enzyme
MAENGYSTACIGKLHHTPTQQSYGFEFARITDSRNPENNACSRWLEKQGKSDYLKNPYADPEAEEQKKRGIKFRWGQDQTPEDYTETAYVTEEAVEFLKRKHDSPLFLHISYKKPHSQHFAPAPWDKLYDPADIPQRVVDEASVLEKPAIFRRQREQYNFHLMRPEDWSDLTARYFGLISYLDDRVGRILDTLEAGGWLENSIIIFTSDHGTSLGEHGYYGKAYNFEFSTKVPLLIHLPGQTSPQTIDKTNKNIDIMPAILERCNISVPGDLQGQNLNRLINGDDKGWDETLYTEMHGILRDAGKSNPRMYEFRKGLRGGEWKISFHAHRSDADPQWIFEWELYNYMEDPCELRNRASDPECAEILDRMKNELLLNICRYEGCFDLSKYGFGSED